MYKNESILQPIAYKPTGDEIKLAKNRYAMDNYVWEIVHYLILYYEMTKGKELNFPYTKENVSEYAESSVNKWNKNMNKWTDDIDILDTFIDHEFFQNYITAGLSDIHSGDCVSFSCRCSRCYSENIFNLPSSATWSKSDGYKLFNEYMNDFKTKNPKQI